MSRSKRNKKDPEISFVDIGKEEIYAIVQTKILNPMVVGDRQSFRFFRQTIRFLENNRVLSEYLNGIFFCITTLVLSNNTEINS